MMDKKYDFSNINENYVGEFEIVVGFDQEKNYI